MPTIGGVRDCLKCGGKDTLEFEDRYGDGCGECCVCGFCYESENGTTREGHIEKPMELIGYWVYFGSNDIRGTDKLKQILDKLGVTYQCNLVKYRTFGGKEVIGEEVYIPENNKGSISIRWG